MKKNIVIGIAIIAILFGLYGLAGNLSKEAAAPVAEVAEKTEKQLQVWMLNQDVEKGQLATRDQLNLVSMGERDANLKGVTDDIKLDFQLGTVFTQALTKGSVAFPELMLSPDQDGYVDLVIAPNRVPFAIKTQAESVVGGIISQGSFVDVLSVSTPDTLIVETTTSGKTSVSVTPIVMGVKVLQVNKQLVEATRSLPESTEVRVIVELTRKQVAKLTVANHISHLEIHKSIGEYQKSDLQADAGDILPGFKSIVEFRADKVVIN
ncbi:Flp pilus assembly protein CpaB [Vibrio sp. T187]|uniref:Flp pilus assembly protein CpaB n=1 Tax=Vibrio TaxID=662 RepID=UPI0010CA103B|nr:MULTISPECIES: Flp pilus assembly protein CpaB [Vibrio]MBW3694701.1 Flp pilus assembly protein CpaB [Vibrio sp. T187]